MFDDTAEGDDGRYLEGTLSNDGSTAFTVIWRGQYSADAPFATSGTYAYNIGPNATSHQRDDGKGGFVVEQYNGTTTPGMTSRPLMGCLRSGAVSFRKTATHSMPTGRT